MLFIRSTGGASATHIVGSRDSSTATGMGAAAVRCVFVTYAGYGGTLEGFTLRDGASHRDDLDGSSYETAANMGGGAGVQNGSTNYNMIDCVFSNCTARYGGGLRGGTAFRCRFYGNASISGGAATRQSNLWNCQVARSRGSWAVAYGTVVNCTFVENQNGGAVSTTAIYNSLFVLTSGTDDIYSGNVSAARNCVRGKVQGQYQVLAPALGDYRVIRGSLAETAGDAQYLAQIALPSGVERKDIDGNTLPESGTIAAGASQTLVTPAAGGIYFKSGVVVEGNASPSATYLFTEAWPTQIVVRPSLGDDETFFRFSVTGASTLQDATSRWLQMDGNLALVPPPGVGTVMTNEPIVAARVLEVTPSDVLQDVVNSITTSDPTVILAEQGEYSSGFGVGGGWTNRVSIPGGRHILLKSKRGAAFTTIRGAADPDGPYPSHYPGCGPAAMRCLSFGSGGAVAVQGFTLADGHTTTSDTPGSNPANINCGAVYSPDSTTSFAANQILDCIVTNCVAFRGGAFGSAWASRCEFVGCRGYGGVFVNAVVSSSTIRGCVQGSAPSGVSGPGYLGQNVWFVHVSSKDSMGLYQTSLRIYSSILYPAYAPACKYFGSVLGGSFSSASGASGYLKADPLFVDAAHGDLRVQINSPALSEELVFPDAGTTAAGTWSTTYASFATLDPKGRKIRLSDGRPMAGAYQRPVQKVTVDAAGTGILADGRPVSSVAVEAGGSVTFSRDASTGVRYASGMAVGGATNDFDSVSGTWTYAVAPDATAAAVSMQAVPSPHWYVSDEVGDDANSGFLPSAAAKTLASVLTNSAVAAGDVVHVAPGRYETGKSYQKSGMSVASRAVVPSGVTLVSDEGPSQTFIVGAPSSTPDQAESYPECGPGAVRCVFLSSRAVVDGFTLCGGRTRNLNGEHSNDDNRGGGVLGAWTADSAAMPLVKNCVISNNVSFRGGGACLVRLVSCLVSGNGAAYSGTAGDNFSIYGCVVRGSGLYFHDVMHSTVDGSLSNPGGDAHACNSVFTGTVPAQDGLYFRCAFADGSGVRASNLGDGSFVTNSAALALDESLRPIPGQSVLTDCANPSYYDASLYGSTDLTGEPRVTNGAMDIGALEADWLPRYADDIRNRRTVEVLSASPDVVETPERHVRLPSGGALSASWNLAGAIGRKAFVKLHPSSSAVVEVRLNGEPLSPGASEDGLVVYSFTVDREVNELSFSVSGADAYADIVGFSQNVGFCVIVF